MKKKLMISLVCLCLTLVPGFSSAQDLLIKNGTVLTVTKGSILNGDVLVVGGIIKKVGKNIKAPKGIKIVDATGKYVIPGVIDSHTHIALTGTNEMGNAIVPEVKMRDVIDAESNSIYCTFRRSHDGPHHARQR